MSTKKQIFLEAKPVFGSFPSFSSYAHLYLVLRDADGDMSTLSYRQSGDVIRGGPDNIAIIGDRLRTYTGKLNPGLPEKSGDDYWTEEDVRNRVYLDITDYVLSADSSLKCNTSVE